MNKLWILLPLKIQDDRWGYDCYHGFVISAGSELAARAIACASAADEGKDAWGLPTNTSCELLVAGEAGVKMSDFNAG